MNVANNKKDLSTNSELSQADLDNWFETFIGYLKADHFILTSGVASEDKRNMYKALIFNDEIELAKNTRKMSTKLFIKSLVKDYLTELSVQKNLPLKLAFGLSDSKILVWSEIEDNNEQMEDALLIAEAKVNGKYHNQGFYINSTIIEKSDNLSIPPHYQKIYGE